MAAKISVLIAAHGGIEWSRLAWKRAYPSAFRQADETLVLHRPKGTVASVRNELAEDATGDWLVFLDADDELADGYCDALREHLDLFPGVDQLLAPAVSYVHPHGYVEAPKFWQTGARDRLKSGNWLVIGTAIARPVFFCAGGFSEWPIYEDWALWLRCVHYCGAEPVRVPQAIYRAYRSEESRNHALSQEECERIHGEILRSTFG